MSREEADELFAKLAEGGQILYPLEEQAFRRVLWPLD